MDSKFFKFYIDKELYIQNPPMRMKNFINFCKDRGVKISKNKLKELENNNEFFPIFRIENDLINNRGEKEYFPIIFSTKNNDLKLLDDNKIIFPSKDNFKPFSEYSNENGEKISSYYSSYQIYELKNIINKENKFFNFNEDLLIAIQLFLPYGRSNQRIMTRKEDKNWRNKIKSFNLDDVLNFFNINLIDYCRLYRGICQELPPLLGDKDMIQLWKHINWEKKHNFKGPIRLGIEYLEWALMLKQCIENHLKREIFDVDECVNYDAEYILNTNPSGEFTRTVRGLRNKQFFNELDNRYEFNLNRKKLLFLANAFSLDYHPRVLIFVEGKTEELILPKLFELCNKKIENVMVDIINIGGINNLFPSPLNDKDENNKYLKILINNYSQLINYFLDNYQTIPFFILDNENDIVKKLKEGFIFDSERLFKEKTGLTINQYNASFDFIYNQIFLLIQDILEEDFEIENNPIIQNVKDYLKESNNLNQKMLDDWTHIWEFDFELDNYTNEELVKAINEVCDLNISLEDIEKLRKNKLGIKSLDKEIDVNKIKINQKLVENLKECYFKTNDESIKERPVFKVINKILNIEFYNYQPVNSILENKNKRKIAENILNGKDNIF